jgi:hypothetical protein
MGMAPAQVNWLLALIGNTHDGDGKDPEATSSTSAAVRLRRVGRRRYDPAGPKLRVSSTDENVLFVRDMSSTRSMVGATQGFKDGVGSAGSGEALSGSWRWSVIGALLPISGIWMESPAAP